MKDERGSRRDVAESGVSQVLSASVGISAESVYKVEATFLLPPLAKPFVFNPHNHYQIFKGKRWGIFFFFPIATSLKPRRFRRGILNEQSDIMGCFGETAVSFFFFFFYYYCSEVVTDLPHRAPGVTNWTFVRRKLVFFK